MNRIKNLIVLFLITIILPLDVSASNGVELKVNKTDLTVGDEIVVSANLSSDMKSYAFLATLKYDENVFEKINDSNFDIDKEKINISYNAKNNKFGIINNSGETSSKLFSVYLRVKDDANVGNTNIALTNVSSSDGKNSETFNTSSIKVSVTRDAKEDEAIPINKENKITKDKEKIITTFTTTPILKTLLFIFLILLCVHIYMCVYKYNKNNKKFYGLFIVEIIILIIIGFLFLFNNTKEDVNKDGKKDYDDAKAIIDYLIDIQNDKPKDNTASPNNLGNNSVTTSKMNYNKFDSDINNDGKVDVKDPASIVTNVNKNIKVKLEEKKDKENYVKKGEKIILNFKASIDKKGIIIKQVKIADKYYDVTLNNGIYSVKLDAPSKSGKYTFDIMEVILSNNKKIKVNLKITKEVLKEVPYVNRFNLNDEKGTLSFNLVDEDKAFIDGTVTIYADEDKVASSSVSKEKTTLKFEAKKDKTYVVKIVGNYDLDSKTGDKKNVYNNQNMFTKSFVIGGDYNFTLTNVSITDVIQENELPVISFSSTNNRNAHVQTVNITTKENTTNYHITKMEENNYEVELTGANTSPGKHIVTLNNVELDALKTFYNNKDYKSKTLTYTVLKDAPKVENLEVTDNHAAKKVKAIFKLKDEFLATNKLTILLVDSTGKIVDEQELVKENLNIGNNIEVSLSYENNTDGFYTVKVLADYELSDNYKYTNKLLEEKNILTTTSDDIYISKMYIEGENLYPTKGKKDYKVVFTIHVGDSVKAIAPAKYSGRNYDQVQSITINGLNYSVDGITGSTTTDYMVKVNLMVPNEAGILKIKANRVQLGISGYYNMTRNDMYSVEEKELIVDVLKDKPKIENLTINDDYDKDEATFNFDVVLDSTEKKENFNDGIIELGDKKKKIHEGHNIVTFDDIEKDTNLNLIFKSSYDLDSGILDKEGKLNKTTNGELFKVLYGLYDKDTYNDIAIENGKIISKNNNQYFEKNEKIKLSFNIINIDSKLNASPSKVIIDDKEYSLTKIDGHYELVLNGYYSSGEKELTITDIILDNGKVVTLKDSYNFKPEVLKDIPTINDFNYEDLTDKIKVILDLKDSDNAIIDNAKVIITDENGKEVYNDDLKKEFTIKRDKNIVRYYVKVIADYDRDIDTTKSSKNYYEKAILLNEIISLDKNNIEFKDIIDINLYKTEEKDGKEVTILEDTVNIEDLKNNLKKYFVEIEMEDMPSARVKINKIVEKDRTLSLVLEYKYVTKEGTKEELIKVEYGLIDGEIAKNTTHQDDAFRILLEKLKSGEKVTLHQNYDASSVEDTNDLAYIIDDYSGTLDGNGYTIKNLTKPLFNKIIKGGTVQNLKLVNVNLSKDGRGALANETNNAKITNVVVNNVSKNGASAGQNGGLIGLAKENTVIENCGVKNANLNVSGDNIQQNGGFVGCLEKSTIRNSYATGKVYNGGNFTAGFAANVLTNSEITNSYSNVDATGSIQCDFACTYLNSTSKYKNNVSLGRGTVFVSANNKILENNYYLHEGASSEKGVTNITKNQINKELFQSNAEFNVDIWYLDKVSFNNNPIFQYEKVSSLSDTTNDDYDEKKENLYANLLKLMPFYDSDKIISLSKNIDDDLLINDEIVHIAPVNKNGNLITYLTTDNPKMINKIKLVFKSGKKKEYDVIYDKTYDMVATYKITSLDIDYNYNHYVINADSQVVNNLTNYLKSLDYTNNLDILTTNDDSRIYRDFYNETTKKELKDFVLKYLSNSNYTNTTNDDAINSYIEREVKKDKKIEKALYVYNYFRRFYDLDIEGMKLYDFVMFDMQGFDKSLTLQKIIDLYIGDGTGSNFSTNITGNAYKNLLSGYTNLTRISNFLEYVVTNFSNQNMDKWTASQFKGILVEIPVKGHDEIQYTLWDHFSNEDDRHKGDDYAVYNYVLPILTLPKTAAYIVSAPAQFTIGAQRVYIGNPNDPQEIAKFKAKMQVYVDRIASYYNTTYSILEDPKLFNDIHLYQIDKRMTKNENGVSVYNNPYSTQEPFHKNFDEVVNVWPANYWVNAGNWGDRIEWNVAGFMDSDIKNDGNIDSGHPTWATWSHETAHYLDARLFLKDKERRYDAGGEDYADEFLMQKFSATGIVMNLSINFKDKLEVATNLTPERINSKDKIADFYSKMFDSIYVLDYIEAMAFLKLPADQQKALGVQISYPNENIKFATKDGEEYNYFKNPEMFVGNTYSEDPYARFRARQTTQYTRLSKVTDVPKLKTIDDLIKNRIMLYTNIDDTTSRGSNSYGGEGINIVHWYQPNNPYGRPDSYSLKWLSYEMLGYKGYDKGFVEYASNNNFRVEQTYKSLLSPNDANGNPVLSPVNYKSDDMAIYKISNGVYKNIDEYKIGRFKQTSDKLKYLKFINVDEYAEKMYAALLEDAQKQDKSYTNSFKVRKEIYYILKNSTDDFRQDIYSNKEEQEITFNTEMFDEKSYKTTNINESVKKQTIAVDKNGMREEQNVSNSEQKTKENDENMNLNITEKADDVDDSNNKITSENVGKSVEEDNASNSNTFEESQQELGSDTPP